jgi:hypothetical protein
VRHLRRNSEPVGLLAQSAATVAPWKWEAALRLTWVQRVCVWMVSRQLSVEAISCIVPRFLVLNRPAEDTLLGNAESTGSSDIMSGEAQHLGCSGS